MARIALCLLLSLAACGGPAPPTDGGGDGNQGAVRVHRMQISQHPRLNFPLNQAELDRIMADTARVISQEHKPAGPHCPVRLEQVGPLRTMPADAPSIVRSAADFARLDDPGVGSDDRNTRAVHVILGINWCGGNSPNVIGCANIPGRAIVVVRQPPDVEGQLWGHEFGHNRGLDHVDDPQRLMNPFLATTAKDVDAQECQAYRGPEPLLQAASERRFPRPAMAAPVVAEVAQARDILAFVRQRNVHGSAAMVAEAARFSAEDVDRAMALLADPAEKAYWANVVLVAGAAGRVETSGRLIAFLFDAARDPGDIAQEQARQLVPVALGYLANRGDNATAMRFLLGHSQPGSWRSYANRARTPAAAAGLERLMASQTIEGLVVSGRPEAIARLEADQKALRETGRPALPGSVRGAAGTDAVRESEMLIDALARAKRVREEGLGAAYKRE